MPEEDLAAMARRVDPDRFFCALFAPAAARPMLWLLAAFSHELARARAVVRDPAVAHIRLQWWREVIEGAERRHPIATPLSAALRAGALEPAGLLRMVDGREIEADEFIETTAAWQDYLLSTQGELAAQSGRLLGITDLEPLRLIGAAHGAGWLVRSHGMLAGQGRCLLPADLLSRHGLSPHAAVSRPGAPEMQRALNELADTASGWLRQARTAWPRTQIAAALPAILAARDLNRPGHPFAPRGLADRLAVLAGFARGRSG